MSKLTMEKGQLRERLGRSIVERHACLIRLMELRFPDVKAMARRAAGSNDGLREDLEDELIWGLMMAARRYDPSQAEFWTYARVVLQGRIRMFFRKLHRKALCEELVAQELCVTFCHDAFEEVARMDSETRAQEWAERILHEVGLTSKVAQDALLGRITKTEAARILKMNYDVFLRKLAQARRTRAAAQMLEELNHLN